MLAGFGIGDIVDIDLGVVFGSVGHLGEFHAVVALGEVENTLADILEGEIVAELGLVQGIFVAAYLLVVIIVVPGLNLHALALGVGDSLHLGNFLSDTAFSGLPDLHEQVLGSLHAAGHDIGGGILAEVGES